MTSDPVADLARLEHAARTARRAVLLALVATAIMVAVLTIDQGIKRQILAEAERARRLLEECRVWAMAETTGRLENGRATGETATPSRPYLDTGHAVDDAPRTPAPVDPDAGSKDGAGGSAPRRAPRRSRGDG